MMPLQQSMDQARALRALADESFDLLVIGGGITGAGVAREASLRGVKSALIEQADFASAPAVAPPSSCTVAYVT